MRALSAEVTVKYTAAYLNDGVAIFDAPVCTWAAAGARPHVTKPAMAGGLHCSKHQDCVVLEGTRAMLAAACLVGGSYAKLQQLASTA